MPRLDVSLWAEVHRLQKVERLSARGIARHLGCHRSTVSKALKLQQPPVETRKPRRTSLDSFHSRIDALIAQNPEIPTARLFEQISNGPEGYDGSVITVRRYLRKVHPHRRTLGETRLKLRLFDIVRSGRISDSVIKKLIDDDAKQTQLCNVLQYGSVLDRKRALAVIARTMGFSERKVARCLKMSRTCVSRAYDTFGRHDNNSSFHLFKRRPRRTSLEKHRRVTKTLIEILHHKPKAYGINRSNWTRQSLADAYEKQIGEKISPCMVGRLFRKAGYTWKKSRRVLTSPDPEYREKVELLLATLHSLKADEMFFFIDELGPLQVKRYGGRCYAPKKNTPTYPQSQRSKGSIVLHAALSATSNQLTWLYGDAKDTAAMVHLVELLFNQYHDKSRLYITWDAASWHSSNQLMEWVDELNAGNCVDGNGPIIEFVPLPASSQFLNVIETVFGTMKKTVVHGSDYQSVEEMKTAISGHFQERNEFFQQNPRRAGNKIWEIDFFEDSNNMRWGNYREW